MRHVQAFIECEDGATSIEYALIAAFIALAIITAVTAAGDAVSNSFNNVSVVF